MRGGDTASRPGRDELTARMFRALYPEFELRIIDGTHVVVVPRETPWFAGTTLSDVARQISEHARRGAEQDGRPTKTVISTGRAE
jgi:hypothetical protein